MYKIGQIYLKTSNPYIITHYQKVLNNPFKSEYEYNKQFLPFYYSDKFIIYTNNNDVEIYIKQISIYNEIKYKINSYKNNNTFKDIKKYKYKSNAKYINNEYCKNVLKLYNILHPKILYKYNIIDLKLKTIKSNDYDLDISLDYIDFWKNLKNIYNYNLASCLNIPQNKIKNILNLVKIIINNNLTDIESLIIIIDKLNIDISKYYFNYDIRIKQIEKVLSYQILYLQFNKDNYHNNTNFIISFKYDDAYYKPYLDLYDNIIIIMPYCKISNKFNEFKNSNVKYCYTKNIKYYKFNNNNLINKYLNKNIVNNSLLFSDYSKEYNINDIYNLDLRNHLKNYDYFNKVFLNPIEIIFRLIYFIMFDLIDDNFKDIIYNMIYLQMFDIIKTIELITNKQISLEILNKNNNVILLKYLICKD